MTPTHIALISHGFQSHYELGFANGLAENGVRVTLLGSDTTLTSLLHPGVEFINIRGAQSPKRSRWEKLRNMCGYHLRLLRYVVTHRQASVMVIGLITPELLVGLFEGALLRLLARNYSLTVHNILPHDKHTPWMRRLYWLIYRLPHLLLVHTAQTAIDLQRDFGIAAAKVAQVEHGSNDAVLPSTLTAEQARRALGFKNDNSVLLFFGGVAPYKGLDLLLDAIDNLPHVNLLVAGRCPNTSYGNDMRARLQTLVGAQRAVWQEGFLTEAQISDVFVCAEAVVLPYRHIDQSGVLLLAVTLGVPVIVTDVGGLKAFVTPETGVIVSQATGAAVFEGVSDFLRRRAHFSRDAIERLGQSYAWKNTIKPLLPTLLLHDWRK